MRVKLYLLMLISFTIFSACSTTFTVTEHNIMIDSKYSITANQRRILRLNRKLDYAGISKTVEVFNKDSATINVDTFNTSIRYKGLLINRYVYPIAIRKNINN